MSAERWLLDEAQREARYLRGLMVVAGAAAEAAARADFLAVRALATRAAPETAPAGRKLSWRGRVARFYAERLGFAIFPMTADKRPLVRGGVHAATRDPETIIGWWRRWPAAVPAAATGAPSGLIVVDIDCKSGKNGLEALRRAGVALPRTWLARSPSGGCHLYFQHPGRPVRSAANVKLFGRVLEGVDIRADAGAIILPSPRSGYRWTVRRPGRCSLAPFPEELVAALEWRPPAPAVPLPRWRPGGGGWQRTLDRICSAIRSAAPGCRQETLAACAWRAGRLAVEGKLDPETALRDVLAAAAAIGGPDWDRAAALSTARRRFEAGFRND